MLKLFSRLHCYSLIVKEMRIRLKIFPDTLTLEATDVELR